MASPRRSSSTFPLPGAAERLRRLPTSEDERFAGQRVVEGCLGMTSSESMLLVFERGLEPIAAGVLAAVDALGATVDVREVSAGDDHPEGREDLRRTLARFDTSVMLARFTFPRALRVILTDGVARRRHAHLLGVTDALVKQSLRADWAALHGLGERLRQRLRDASEIRVESPSGTDLRIAPDRKCRWHNQSGLQRTPGWTNLPAGEVTSSPQSASGIFVPDGGILLTGGEPFERTLTRRLKVHFARGEVVDVEGPSEAADQLLAHLDAHANGRRIGQVAFGTNTDVLAPIGVPAQDLKQPGLHLVLGYTAPEATGARWNSDVLVNLMQRRESVWVDGAPLLRRGRFVDGF